jgi:ADP-ribosylglycohydrolase
MEKREQLEGRIYGALAADALSLGSHWVYNSRAIEKRLGRPDRLTDPIVNTFHPKRKAGEFTHYGDQLLWLLNYVADKGGYEGSEFFKLWIEKMGDYDGYMDHASEETLKAGKASEMDDLAGAGRTAVLSLLFPDDSDGLATAAADHASLTHNHPIVRDTARFFSLLLFEDDKPMKEALEAVLTRGSWESDAFEEAVRRGVDTADEETTPIIEKFGQMCSAERALPSTMHLLVKYPEDYREAMVANCAAGGDSAARGLLAGMVLGSRLGFSAIPKEWISGLAYLNQIEGALKNLLD